MRPVIGRVFRDDLAENVGRKAIFHYLPYAAEPTRANVVVNATFVALMLLGLALSLRAPRTAPEAAP